ncbi:heparinase [Glycocaulis profundi]|nr:heparinase [Glycocaulis profundi]
MASALHRRARRELSDIANAIGPYRAAALSGRAPARLAAAPVALGAGDPARGAAILAGRFTIAGETMACETIAEVWDRPSPSRRFAAGLHGFEWLGDLIAAGPEGEAAARAHCDTWIAEFGRWNWFSWGPHVAARRVRNWLMAADILVSDEPGSRARLRSLARQARRLRRAMPLMEEGRARLEAAYALALAGVCLDMGEGFVAAGGQALGAALKRQILPDGGHASRCPQTAADMLCDLVSLEEAARRRGAVLHDEIGRAIDRLAPAVAFFRLGPEGVAAFHGGGQGDGAAIAAALKACEAPARPFNVAPHSGYHRLEAGGAVAILDAGGPPAGPQGQDAHASALAFEFAVPESRIVVSCGWTEDQPSSWREAVRATAAHSALTIEETSSARLLGPGLRRSVLGARIARGPDPVRARRNEEEGGVWLEASHEGYRDTFGLVVRRRLFMDEQGGDLRGEDSLAAPVGAQARPDAGPVRYAIRFHLHPEVKASLARDSMSVLLAVPGGAGWRFRTDGGPVRLERSVYLAEGAPPRRSTQLVVAGEAEAYGAGDQAPNRVRWAFQRMDRAAAGETG